MTTHESEKTSATPQHEGVLRRVGAMSLGALCALLVLGSVFALSHVDSAQEQTRREAVELPAIPAQHVMVSHTSTFNASEYELSSTGAATLESTDNTDAHAVMGPFASANDFCALHYAQELKEEASMKCSGHTLNTELQKDGQAMLIAVGEDPALTPNGRIDYFVATSTPKGWMASHWKTREFKESSAQRTLVTESLKGQVPAFAVSMRNVHATFLR